MDRDGKSERRRGIRRPLNLAAVLNNEAREMKVRIRDASLSGVFLESAETAPHLSSVTLRIPAHEDQSLKGSIARIATDGFGVEWQDPGEANLLALTHTEGAAPPDAPAPPEHTVHHDALVRAQSEIESDEFDVQG